MSMQASQYATTRLKVKTRCSTVMETLLGILFLLSALIDVNGDVYDDPIYHCSHKQPQQSLHLSHIMGIWYVVEAVHHRSDTDFQKGISIRDFCPVVNLQEETHGLTLLYEEPNFSTRFSLQISDPVNQPGVWVTRGGQNVTLPANKRYSHFAGTIEVMKAVGSHMVLTYCSPGTQLFSKVLSRRKHLDAEELNGVNRMLERRGLNKVSVFEFCKGGASSSIPSAILIVFLILYCLKNNTA